MTIIRPVRGRPPSVVHCLKPYIYGLIDPRTGAMFYVGKGTGYRVGAHETEARAGKSGPKNARIRDIHLSGLVVKRVILEYFETDFEAYQAERSLISKHRSSLTNRNRGGSGKYGLGPYGYFQAKAQELLLRFLPYEIWVLNMSAEYRQAVANVFGSPRVLYTKLRAELEKEARSPSPNTVTFVDGQQPVFGWEY